ncbi:MAG: HNH endonuclease [Bdellovibrionia bacterium]
MSKVFFASASPEHQKREKAKARELRQSQWWKQQLGKGLCYHCGQRFPPSELTMDHLLPIARGGKSDKKNCVPSCKECNTKKGHRLPVEEAFERLESLKKESDSE